MAIVVKRRSIFPEAASAAMVCALVAGACVFVVTATERPALAAPTKVSCIGEHTTHSDLYSNDREHQPVGMQEYPMILQGLLGSAYDVRNHGDCCASIVQGYPHSETHPYVGGSNYTNSINFKPDVVVIGSWGRHDWGLSRLTAAQVFTFEKFQTDYEDLVKRYVNLPNHPKIFCSTPIPILFGNDGPDNGYKTSPAADAVKAVAAKYNLPIIDLFNGFLGHKELFRSGADKDPEGEHLNDAGMKKIADMVAAALKGVDGSMGGAGGAGAGGTGGAGAGAGGAGVAGSGATGGNGGDGAAGVTGGGGGQPVGVGGSSGSDGNNSSGGSPAGGVGGGEVAAGGTGGPGTANGGGIAGSATPGGSSSSGGGSCSASRSPHAFSSSLMMAFVMVVSWHSRRRGRRGSR